MRFQGPLGSWWVRLVYILLFTASVPWYLPRGRTPHIWLGLPRWVVLSLGFTILIAIFTVFVILRYWHDEESDPPDASGSP